MCVCVCVCVCLWNACRHLRLAESVSVHLSLSLPVYLSLTRARAFSRARVLSPFFLFPACDLSYSLFPGHGPESEFAHRSPSWNKHQTLTDCKRSLAVTLFFPLAICLILSFRPPPLFSSLSLLFSLSLVCALSRERARVTLF